MQITLVFEDETVVTSSTRRLSPETTQLAPYSIRLEATKMLEEILETWERTHPDGR